MSLAGSGRAESVSFAGKKGRGAEENGTAFTLFWTKTKSGDEALC
jgi:hypothetical protein